MSVRMALAKLCACTCGGAIIGGGAVHVAENPPARPSVVAHSASHVRSGAYVRYASAQRRLVRRVVRRPSCAAPTQTVQRMIIPAVFAPPPPPPEAVASSGGGG